MKKMKRDDYGLDVAFLITRPTPLMMTESDFLKGAGIEAVYKKCVQCGNYKFLQEFEVIQKTFLHEIHDDICPECRTKETE